MVRKEFLIILIFFMFSFNFVSSEINIIATANLTDSSSSVFMQTNEKATTDFDQYDLEYPPFPGSRNVLYSSSNGKQLIMDSWDSNDREIKLVLDRTNSDTEMLDLQIKGFISQTFKAVLYDYGTDSSYKTPVASKLITGNDIYTTELNSQKRYFILKIDYLYCGDAICSEEEDCSTCSIDCDCGSEQLNSEQNPYYFLKLNEIEEGSLNNFKISEGYTFSFKNKIYAVILDSVSDDDANFLIQPTLKKITLNEGNLLDVDLDSDNETDISLASSNIGPEEVTLSIQGINPDYFSISSIEDVKTESKISIFDESFDLAGVPIYRIIIFTILIIIFLWIIVISFFLIRKKMKNKNVVNNQSIIPQQTNNFQDPNLSGSTFNNVQ